MNNKLTKNFNIKYSEMNHDLSLKPYSLLNYLQDIASESAQELGFGYTYMNKKNLAWFLIKYKMEFIEYPQNIYDIKISTSPRGYNKLFAYRDFELFNDDKIYGKVFSMWSTIDLNTRSTIAVGPAINNPNMPQFEKKDNDLSFSKIKPLSKIDNQKEFFVRYNDLDVNGHANNGNYITWALEVLDYNFLTEHKIKSLDMFFKKEAKYGENIFSQVEIKNNLTSHKIINSNNEDLCLIECEWN